MSNIKYHKTTTTKEETEIRGLFLSKPYLLRVPL